MFGIRKRNRTSIQKKIYKNNMILIVFIVLFLEIIFILGLKSYYLGSIDEKMNNKMSQDSLFFNADWLREVDQNERFRLILEDVSLEKNIYGQLIDKEKNLIVDSYGDNEKLLFADRDIDSALKGEQKSLITNFSSDKKKILVVSAPLYSLDETVMGVVRYSVSIDKVYQVIYRIILLSFFVLLLVIIVSLIFSLLLAREIINPIEELIRFSNKRAEGDFSGKIEIENKDELGILADTFNHMSEEIRKNEEMKNDFISSVSHEIKTPLTAIQGWAETLSIEGLSIDDRQMGLEIIKNETERLKGLVEELLDYSKIERKGLELSEELVFLNKLLLATIEEFRPFFEEKNICLELSLEEEVKIIADFNRIKQVFVNIISNSLKFTDAYGKIKIILYRKEDSVCVDFIDNGIGIAEEDLDLVLQKFFKGNKNYPGSGLGLSISKKIMELHGGNLFIDSSLSKGTVVHLEFKKILEA